MHACTLLERRMRGAGLEITAQNSPVAKWHAEWVDSGVCAVQGTHVQQNVLGDAPLIVTVTAAMAAGRAPPRPDWAPPHSLPQHTLTVYLNGIARGPGAVWSAVGVHGGDGTYDEHAQLRFEAAAPATDNEPGAVALEALRNAQRLAQASAPVAPIHVRAPPWMASLLSGIDGGHSLGPILREWNAARATRPGWLTQAAPHDNLPWADRAFAIAGLSDPGKAWGDPGPAYATVPRAVPPSTTVCCVCYEDYEDVLPAAGVIAPTAAGLFACRHAVCRECDMRVQQSAITTCPMCRAGRVHWILRRP